MGEVGVSSELAFDAIVIGDEGESWTDRSLSALLIVDWDPSVGVGDSDGVGVGVWLFLTIVNSTMISKSIKTNKLTFQCQWQLL